jgi:hypothetical protein
MGVLYLICWRRNYPHGGGTRPNVAHSIVWSGRRMASEDEDSFTLDCSLIHDAKA